MGSSDSHSCGCRKMKFSGWIFGLAVVALGLFMTVGGRDAHAYTTFLNLNNGSLDEPPFAQVDIVANGDDIDFTITMLAPDGTGLDIEAFGFNSAGPNLALGNISGLSGWVLDTNSQFAIFGQFEYALECCTGGGTGSGVSPLTFSITGVVGDTVADYASQLSTGNGNELFVLKTSADGAAGPFIAGGSVVPIPAALPLFLSGLAVFGLVARRRRAAAAA